MPQTAPDPTTQENWIVTIKGMRLGSDRVGQTYELTHASLDLTSSMREALDGWPLMVPAAQMLVLKGLVKAGVVEPIPETSAELTAALERGNRIERAVREALELLGPDTWGAAADRLRSAL